MSENKSVIIDIEETEKTRLGEFSKLESVATAGVLSVNNVSERARIWNVRVLLGESRDSTDIESESIPAGEVEAGGKWETDYSVKVSKPILKLTEVFDTCSEIATEEPHWAYVHGKNNHVRITLTVKNETDGQLADVILNKTIPLDLSDITIESAKSGSAEFDEGTPQVVRKDLVTYPK